MAVCLRSYLGDDVVRRIQQWSRPKGGADYRHTMWWSDIAIVLENRGVHMHRVTRRWPWSRTLTKIQQSDRYLLVLGHLVSSVKWRVVVCTVNRCGVVQGVYVTTLTSGQKGLSARLEAAPPDAAVAALSAPSSGPFTHVTVCRSSDLNPEERRRWDAIRRCIGMCVPSVVGMHMRGETTIFEIRVELGDDHPPKDNSNPPSARIRS